MQIIVLGCSRGAPPGDEVGAAFWAANPWPQGPAKLRARNCGMAGCGQCLPCKGTDGFEKMCHPMWENSVGGRFPCPH